MSLPGIIDAWAQLPTRPDQLVPEVRRLLERSGTAAVLDRAVAKDLSRRYPDAARMAGELEEVLAIETSRSGQATGEVTTILRTLPGVAQRRVPWRTRHPARWIASIALLAVIVAIVLFLAVGSTHRGSGVGSDVVSRGLQPVQLLEPVRVLGPGVEEQADAR